jgi:hypothetical protein
LNKKFYADDKKNNIQKFNQYEIVTVVNDRYFGSCEENLYRVGDFSDLLYEHVFCVGEHDFIDWALLNSALERFSEQKLGVLAWNIKCRQMTSRGDYAELSAIFPLDFQSTANEYCHMLLSKEVLDSTLAYPALISIYGPIDWAAYLGNHLFRKDIFQKVLQYKFSEYVYSFVYKQLLLFSSNQIRYGFFEDSVIWRISDDFLKIKEDRHSAGWLEDHRTVQGLSNCFWISNLQYLVEVKNKSLFNLVTNSMYFPQLPDINTETIQYAHFNSLIQFLMWSMQVINYKLNGKSYYFNDLTSSGGMGDIFTVSEYLKILLNQAQINKIYGACSEHFITHLLPVVIFLSNYLGVNCSSGLLLENCLNHLDKLIKLIEPQSLISLNQKSFSQYASSI